MRRSLLKQVRRVVIKVGSRVLTVDSGGLDHAVIQQLSDQIAALRRQGIEVILVSSGVMRRDALKKCRMSAFTLMSMLRAQGYNKLQDVNFAVFEAGGNLSVFPKNSARPVTVKDLALKQPEEGLTMPVIVDGQIFRDMLDYAKVDETWLRDQLHSQFMARPEDVFYAEIDDQKALYVNLMNETMGNAPPPARDK